MRRVRLIVWTAFLFSFHFTTGQICLQLVDSITEYEATNSAKTLAFSDQLIQLLDSGVCRPEVGYAEAYTRAGLVYRTLREQDRAVGALEKALKFKRTQVDTFNVDMLTYANNLFAVHRDFGSYVPAKTYLSYTEAIVRQSYSPTSLDYILFSVSSSGFYREIGEFQKSEQLLREALASVEQQYAENDSLKGEILIEQGTLYRQMGQFRTSGEIFEHAIKLLRGKYPQLRSKAVDRLAKLNLEQGKFSTSESELLSNVNFKQARFPQDQLLLVESYNNLGQLYFRLNDLENAKSYFQELYTIGQAYPVLLPYVENNLAVINERLGNLEEAEAGFNRAKDLLLDAFGPLHPDYASCLSNLAGVEKRLGKGEKALELYMKVLDLDRAVYGEKHQQYATSLTNLAFTYLQLGYEPLALKFLEQSARVRLEALGEHHHLYAKSLNDLGLTTLYLKDTVQALTYFDSALHIEIRHLHDVLPVLTERQRTLFYEDIRTNQQRFSSIAFSPKFVRTEWSEKALDHFINTKSILFYASDRLRSMSANHPNVTIRNTYISWRELKFNLAKAYLLSEEDRHAQGIDVEELEKESQNMEKELSLALNLEVAQEEKVFYSWKDLAKALPDGTALLEMVEFKPYQLQQEQGAYKQGFVDESNYVAFIISPDLSYEIITWADKTDFKDSFKFYRNSMIYGLEDKRSYAVLWKPIEEKLPAGLNKLYFAADGGWHQLNPSTFLDLEKNEFVADRLRVLHLTSGKDLLENENKAYNREALVVGNPDFKAITLAKGLVPLPNAEVEAHVVSDMLTERRWKTNEYYGATATENKVKEVTSPGIIHLATHGYFLESQNANPLLNSGLFLSKDKEQDGVLSAYEAMNLNLSRTRLVVLSACETGLGEVQNGEGVFGLQRAFLVAGAHNLIISLVKVGDKATRDFMEWFYQNLLETDSVEEAFFRSRVNFKEAYPDTKDWGSFILLVKN